MQKLFDEETHAALQQLMDETIEALQLAKASPDVDDLGATYAVALLKVGLAIRSGTVQVNTPIASSYASAGGQRMSGVGRERGIEGLRLYQQLSVLNMGG